MIKLTTIKSNPDNPRLIKDEKFHKLCESLKSFGEKMMPLRPIVIDENNIILGGNMRFKALKEIGYKEVPDDWIKRADDLTDDQKREFIIKDNVGFGEWDFDILSNEWDVDQLEQWGMDIDNIEMDDITEVVEDDFEVPEEIQTDIVYGDIIEIGNHRLMCGDSTNSDDVEKLMNGKKADMVFTDPPYGIDVVGGNKSFGKVGGNNIVKSNSYVPIIGDNSTNTAKEFYNTCLSFGFKNFIIWGGNYFTEFLPPKKGWIVWDKKGRQWDDNFSDFELAWTSFDKIAKIFTHTWMGIVQSGEREKRVHPTQKPSKLVYECIEYYDNESTLIYDGFLGSGSTMVASHQSNRKCYGMELEPRYCQVIIDRMLNLEPNIDVKINGKPYHKELVES